MRSLCRSIVIVTCLFGLACGCGSKHQDSIPEHQGENPFAKPDSANLKGGQSEPAQDPDSKKK